MQLIQLSAQFRKLTHLTDSLLLKTLYITDELNFTTETIKLNS